MSGGFGAMLSLRVHGGEAAAMAVAANVAVFGRATSLGGTESLIEHRASIEGASTPVPADLLRLSIGLEHTDDLVADLEQALELGAVAPATPSAGVGAGAATAAGPVPEGDRAMVIARGGELLDGSPSGSPGAWLPLGYRRPDTGHGAGSRPGRPTPPDLPLLERVQQLLAEQVAPSVATHGGRVELDGVDPDGTVRIRLEDGCQGCALAEVTVHQGIVPLLRAVPGVRAVLDVTDHPAGAAPYYKPAKR
jgi:Fe-S cluster biogenesis protein NfuA